MSPARIGTGNFLNFPLRRLEVGEVIRIELDRRAYARLMDPPNFRLYCGGYQDYFYHGGELMKSPIYLKPPHAGEWHLAVDLGGKTGQLAIQVSIRRDTGQLVPIEST